MLELWQQQVSVHCKHFLVVDCLHFVAVQGNAEAWYDTLPYITDDCMHRIRACQLQIEQESKTPREYNIIMTQIRNIDVQVLILIDRAW